MSGNTREWPVRPAKLAVMPPSHRPRRLAETDSDTPDTESPDAEGYAASSDEYDEDHVSADVHIGDDETMSKLEFLERLSSLGISGHYDVPKVGISPTILITLSTDPHHCRLL